MFWVRYAKSGTVSHTQPIKVSILERNVLLGLSFRSCFLHPEKGPNTAKNFQEWLKVKH